MPREVRAIGPSYYLNDRMAAAQRSINLHPMRIEGAGEDSALALESAPGLLMEKTLTGETINGLYMAEQVLLASTNEGYLYRWNLTGLTRPAATGGEYGWPTFPSGSIVAREFGSSFSGRYISQVHGTSHYMAVDGTKAWYGDFTGTDVGALTQLSTPAFGTSKTVGYLDGYFITIKDGTEQFYISGLDDPTSWNALDFSSADGKPDLLVTQAVSRRTLYLFGERTTEAWSNTGNATFPFERIDGAAINVGCVGSHAVCNIGAGLAFVGYSDAGGPFVFRLTGFQAERISNQAVEQALAKCTNPSAIRMWTYQDAGTEFVAIDAPGLDTTWVWDEGVRDWHERGEYSAGVWSRSRIKYAVHVAGRQYAAGAGPKLYRMGRQYTDLDGDALMRERTWPHLVHPNFEPIRYPGLEIRCTSGDESAAGTISLEVSNDGGETFLSPLSRALGQAGRNTQRIRWLGLGTCPASGSRVFRLRCSSDVPLTIYGARLDAILA